MLRKIEGKETQELLKEWADKIASYDPQADLKSRIERYTNNEKKKPSGKPAPSDLQPGPVADMNRPGHCYASVIKPLTGLAVKGAASIKASTTASMAPLERACITRSLAR